MARDRPKPRARRPDNAEFRVDSLGDALELHRTTRQLGAGCFMLFWLTGWTAGCVMLLVQVVREPSVFTFLFGVPFWASWVFVFCMLLTMLFGRRRLRLDRHGLDFATYALFRLRHRSVPIEELVRADAGRGPGGTLTVETAGRPVRIATGISAAERRWLAGLINDYIGADGRPTIVDSDEEEPIDAELVPPDERADAEGPDVEETAVEERPRRRSKSARTIKLGPAPRDAPSDTRLRLRREIGEIEFAARGRWNLASIAAMTFVCLFWNGIVSIFVVQLFLKFEWFLFFFLIPFEAVGALLLFGLLTALAAPVRTIAWQFGRREIRRREGLFGLGRTQRHAVVPLERIEMQHHRAEATRLGRGKGRGKGVTVPGKVLDGDIVLRFITKEEETLVEIPGLTKGEARWIGDTVLREFPSWFEY